MADNDSLWEYGVTYSRSEPNDTIWHGMKPYTYVRHHIPTDQRHELTIWCYNHADFIKLLGFWSWGNTWKYTEKV